MKRDALLALRDYLNERTLPGKPYQVATGVAWSVVLPRQNYAEDLKATLGDSRVRTLVGIIMPGGSRKLETSRGYGPDQPRAGAIREMDVSLTIFARSLKAYAYEGELLEIEDVLQELLTDFSAKDSPTVEAASLGSLTLAVIPPDFTVLEFSATLRYKTASHRAPVSGTVGGAPPVGGGGTVIIPGDPIPPNPDGTVTLPDGTVVTPGPGGGVTLPDGTVVPPNPDGTVTLPGTPVTVNPDGTVTVTPAPDGSITLPDGTVIYPNPDGSYTLPDGTVVWPNPDGTVTLPPSVLPPGTGPGDTVIIPGPVIVVTPGSGSGPGATPPVVRPAERRRGLLHYVLTIQRNP